jgi:hypothetical protein
MTLNARIISCIQLAYRLRYAFPEERHSTLRLMLFRISAKRYKKRYKSVKCSSVSDLSAFAEQEISKDGTVLASQYPFWKGFLVEKGRSLKCSS